MDPQQQPPPQQQPGWAPPPQQQPGWGQATYTAPPARPGGVTFAGIFLIVVGVLVLIAAALMFVGGAAIGGLGDEMGLGGAFAGMFTVVAIILLLWAIAHILGGYGALTGKTWGRATGIVVSGVALFFGILGLLGFVGAGGQAGAEADMTGLIINVVLLLLYGVTIWVLIKAGPWFAYRR